MQNAECRMQDAGCRNCLTLKAFGNFAVLTNGPYTDLV